MSDTFLDQALALFNTQRRLELRGVSDHQADLQFAELLPEEQLMVLELEFELKERADPTAADLDAVADEERIRAATGRKRRLL